MLSNFTGLKHKNRESLPSPITATRLRSLLGCDFASIAVIRRDNFLHTLGIRRNSLMNVAQPENRKAAWVLNKYCSRGVQNPVAHVVATQSAAVPPGSF